MQPLQDSGHASATLSQNSCQESKSVSTASILPPPALVNAKPVTPKDETVVAAELDAYPEGGRVAWRNVLGAYTNSFGVYQDYYNRVYLSNTSSSTISWIGSISAFLLVLLGIPVGHLYDRGYFYHLLYGGCVVLSFSTFMLSLAQPGAFYQIFLVQGLGVGIGAGMVYIPSMAVVSQYFHRRRALAMTLVAGGASLAPVVNPIMLNNTLDRLGFATATRANAALNTGLLLVGCALTRLRCVPVAEEGGGSGWRAMWTSARAFARDPPYVLTVIGISVFIVDFYFPLFYIQLDAIQHGLSPQFSFYALVILNGCSFAGRLLSGALAHYAGVGRVVTASAVACAVLVFGMIGLHTVASVVAIASIYGFFAGAYIALLGPFLVSMAGSMSETGLRLGIAWCMSGFGSLIGTPIEGALLTGEYVWWRPAVFSGVVGMFGVGCLVAATVLMHRREADTRSENTSVDDKA
ncbi:MFS general substrate transporter [Epithele typhae]|uniref:MFS general substrate transporter n=1 Tax=Epithele typhae TaxID=378194 RepID=UPI002007B6F3|nr:MFS general substrate transporter [Epithele typhae]KAH9931990.1 MFS general substrate transporter [Epithele typhae]